MENTDCKRLESKVNLLYKHYIISINSNNCFINIFRYLIMDHRIYKSWFSIEQRNFINHPITMIQIKMTRKKTLRTKFDCLYVIQGAVKNKVLKHWQDRNIVTHNSWRFNYLQSSDKIFLFVQLYVAKIINRSGSDTVITFNTDFWLTINLYLAILSETIQKQLLNL